MRISSYNIYVPLKDEEKNYMFINGCLGTIDVVSEDVFDKIMNIIKEVEKIQDIDGALLETLKKRGYITDKTVEEERKEFQHVVEIVQNVSRKYVHFTIMPTYNCNFRCSYCYERDLLKKNKNWLEAVITEDVIDRTFDMVDKLEAEGKKVNRTFTLYGGEPLLKENYDTVKYLVSMCKERNITLRAISNGHDLDYYGDLLGADGIQSIQITLDGIAEYHNKKRFLKGNKPTFDKVTENIGFALEKGVDIALRSNIDTNNLNQVSRLTSFYNEKGWAEKPNFMYYFKNVHGCYISEKLYVKEDQIYNEIQQNDGKSDYKHSNIGITLAKNMKYLLESGKFVIPRASFCGATTSMYVVDPFGDIYPCWEVVGQKEDCCIGNVNEENFQDREIYKYWRNRDINHIKECSGCVYAIFCGGGCPAHIRARKGDIYMSYCGEFKEIFNDVVAQVYAEYIHDNSIISCT